MVTVEVTDGTRIIKISANTADELLPEARKVFGEGIVTSPDDVVLTAGYGTLTEGTYVWRPTAGVAAGKGPGSTMASVGNFATAGPQLVIAAVLGIGVYVLKDGVNFAKAYVTHKDPAFKAFMGAVHNTRSLARAVAPVAAAVGTALAMLKKAVPRRKTTGGKSEGKSEGKSKS